jgi:acyl-CoA dehydrogenase
MAEARFPPRTGAGGGGVTTAVDRDQAFLSAVRRVAEEVATAHADDVDRSARFPREAIDALREERALSAFVPEELGGGGVSFAAVAEGCFELGRRCAASAMVFAMHQIQVVSIVRHLDGSPWFEGYLRELADGQRLIASVTSEVGTGGDMGRSVAAVTPGDDGRCRFEKQAPTVSYGAHADDFLTTVRRAPEAEPNDQVAVLTTGDQTTLEQVGTWDPLGMRGTCSPGYVVRAEFAPEQVLGAPFSSVAAESMVPVSHILWSHIWLGIAFDAFDRARAFVRAAAKRSAGETPPMAVRLSHLSSDLSLLRAEVASGLADYLAAADEPGREWLATMAAALRFNNLKIAASEQSPRVCQGAMSVCGIVGYKNDTPFSVGRHLRDAMSGCLMVANERIHQTNAGLLLIAKEV